jgi:hypothetical protein
VATVGVASATPTTASTVGLIVGCAVLGGVIGLVAASVAKPKGAR